MHKWVNCSNKPPFAGISCISARVSKAGSPGTVIPAKPLQHHSAITTARATSASYGELPEESQALGHRVRDAFTLVLLNFVQATPLLRVWAAEGKQHNWRLPGGLSHGWAPVHLLHQGTYLGTAEEHNHGSLGASCIAKQPRGRSHPRCLR